MKRNIWIVFLKMVIGAEQETAALMERMQQKYETWGYTYFAVEVLATGEWIGFIGLAYQGYKTEFAPATDIGWRLKQSAWGNGYATEGAKRCLEFAFEDLGLESVFAVCTIQNTKSENVMQKIGMTRKGEFNHPELSAYPDCERCVWYEVRKG